jgi:hypothetical protein
MTLQEFTASITREDRPPAELSDILKALWLAEKGQWNDAHVMVQAIGTPEASWVHASLHREEGDQGNADYWYARASREMTGETMQEERQGIISVLLAA